MPGIVSYGAYIPYWRLSRAAIAATLGSGGGKGSRSVASYDEDSTSLGVEAARIALRSAPADARRPRPDLLHDGARLPRQDERHRHPRRARAADLGRRLRRGRCGALERDGVQPGRRGPWPGRAERRAHGPARRRGRGGRRRRGRGAAVRRRPRCPGRDHRRWHGDRGVPRPLAHAGRRALPPVGGALRRARLRAAGRRGDRRRAQVGRPDGRRPGPRDRHRPARPSRGQRAAGAGRAAGGGGRRPHDGRSATPAPPTHRCS